MGDLCKESVYVITIFGRSLKEVHSVPVGELLPHVARDLVVVSVNFVPDQNPQNFRGGIFLYLPEPVWTAVECWLIGDVIYEDEGVG